MPRQAGSLPWSVSSWSGRPPPKHVLLEAARQAALASYGVMQATPLPQYDAVTAAVVRLTQAPIAVLVIAAADRLLVKSACGCTFAQAGAAFGQLADLVIPESGALSVPDLAADIRFNGHPATQPPLGARAYAAAPLDDVDGYRLGGLCVLLPMAGGLPPAELAWLSALAAEVVADLADQRERGPTAHPSSRRRIQAWLGVRTHSDHPSNARPGLIVTAVARHGPAARAGIRPTDVLLDIDGHVLRRSADLSAALVGRLPGEPLRVRVMRGGRDMQVVLAVESAP